MAATVSVVSTRVAGNRRVVTADVTVGNYASGGVTGLNKAALGLTSIETLFAEPKSGYVFQYDITNSKLKAYETSTVTSSAQDAAALAEVPNSDTGTATVSTRVVAVGF